MENKPEIQNEISIQASQICLPTSNLCIKKKGYDINGNYGVIVGFPNDRGFFIQTNGVMNETQKILKSYKKLSEIPENELKIISSEITNYVNKFGSRNVKGKLKIYGQDEEIDELFNLGNNKNPKYEIIITGMGGGNNEFSVLKTNDKNQAEEKYNKYKFSTELELKHGGNKNSAVKFVEDGKVIKSFPELNEVLGTSFSAERRQGRRNTFTDNKGKHSPQSPQSQAALEESKLRKIVREAYDKVFDMYVATANLNETSDIWAKQLTPEQIAKCEKMIVDAVNQTGNWKAVHWQIQGNLTNPEMNYIFDRFVEGYMETKDSKYKRAIWNFYNPLLAPDVLTYLYHRLDASTPLDQVAKNPEEFNENILTPVLGRMFAGGTITPKETGIKIDAFDNMINNVKPGSKTFGSFVMNTILLHCKDLINEKVTKGVSDVSLDAPLQSTGKNLDLGDENDNTGDYEDSSTLDVGIDPEDTENKKKERLYRGNTELTIEKLNKAFEEICNVAISKGISEDKVVAFFETAVNYKSPEEIAKSFHILFPDKQKVGVALNNLKIDKKFERIASEILMKYNFPGNILKNIKWNEIYKLGKELSMPKKFSDTKKQDTRYVYEQFVNENIDKIYARIKAKLTMQELKK